MHEKYSEKKKYCRILNSYFSYYFLNLMFSCYVLVKKYFVFS